jgi:hypothetical protein
LAAKWFRVGKLEEIKLRTEIIRNFRKMGFFGGFFQGDVGFWG